MIYLTLALFILLQILDGHSTLKFLTEGTAREGNPIGRWFMKKFGILGGIIISKVAAIGVAVGYVIAFPSYWWMLIPVCILYLWAVIGNYD